VFIIFTFNFLDVFGRNEKTDKFLQVVVFMRNQEALVKVVQRILMMSANIVMDIKMLIRKSYLKLGMLQMECRHILVSFS